MLKSILDLLQRKRLASAPPENEAAFRTGVRWLAAGGERDREPYTREELLAQSLEAWRVNPLARRIVALTTQYVVGGGISLNCSHPATARFIHQFWDDPLNHMAVRCMEWCDELTRTGNLFILLTTDAGGRSYVRAVPAAQMERIEAAPNDIEQPVRFWPKATLEDPEPLPWPSAWGEAYSTALQSDAPVRMMPPVMLHYAVNRPCGAQWGEPDLAPVLKWLARYANWLEDRARLNRYRNTFLFVVRSRFSSEADRLARQRVLNAAPPAPGSILVCDENETWEVINPQLEAADANADGLALKKMIAAGAGLPMHFLAEPEGATRTTAEAAGGPTYRAFEQRQEYFLWLLSDLLRVVVRRGAAMMTGRGRPDPAAAIEASGADISARDNLALASAARNITPVVADLHQKGLVEDAELLRLFYRFAGESVDAAAVLAARKKAEAV